MLMNLNIANDIKYKWSENWKAKIAKLVSTLSEPQNRLQER